MSKHVRNLQQLIPTKIAVAVCRALNHRPPPVLVTFTDAKSNVRRDFLHYDR